MSVEHMADERDEKCKIMNYRDHNSIVAEISEFTQQEFSFLHGNVAFYNTEEEEEE